MGGSRVTDEINAISAQLLCNQLADAMLGRSSESRRQSNAGKDTLTSENRQKDATNEVSGVFR
jgi:hypothetical protein